MRHLLPHAILMLLPDSICEQYFQFDPPQLVKVIQSNNLLYLYLFFKVYIWLTFLHKHG